jgi:hypothetical protein
MRRLIIILLLFPVISIFAFPFKEFEEPELIYFKAEVTGGELIEFVNDLQLYKNLIISADFFVDSPNQEDTETYYMILFVDNFTKEDIIIYCIFTEEVAASFELIVTEELYNKMLMKWAKKLGVDHEKIIY